MAPTTAPDPQTHAYGDVPFIDPATGRFPDEFAPPSVSENVEKAEGILGDVTELSAAAHEDRVAAGKSAFNAAASATAAQSSEEDALRYAQASAGSSTKSAGSASESDGFRNLSSEASNQASESANAAERSRSGAQQLLEQMEAKRDAPNGYATLGPDGLIPTDRLPVGAMSLRGAWDASTNTPTLANGTGRRGYVYVVQTAGDRDLGSGVIDFLVGDQLMHDGTRWHKIDNTDQVTSVAGRKGVVTLVKTDVGLGNVDNTSDANKPVSTATQAVLDQTINGASVVGDNLVFTKVGGGQVNAGNVRGQQGTQGLQGDLQAVAGNPASTVIGGTITPLASWLASTRSWLLGANVVIAAMPSPSASYSGTLTLVLRQAASGGPYSVTFPSNISWSGPTNTPAPSMPTQANAELIVHLFWTGFAWRGMFGGVFL